MPRWEVAGPAAKTFRSVCRYHMGEFEAGHIDAEEYVRSLRAASTRADQHKLGHGFPDFEALEWLPASMRPTDHPKLKPLAETAAQEALHWGPLFLIIESHIRALSTATTLLSKRFGYSANLSRWQVAFDALAPFVGDPHAATAASEKNTDRDRSRGGRPQNDEPLSRELLTGWNAFEPEEGRKTKDGYLAQRRDVRVLKTKEARQRKIASLRVALDSALHLRREKTRQLRKSRG